MTGIPTYAKGTDDFSTNGLGLLTPIECTVEEQAAGMYELTLVQPIDDTYRWAQIQGGCIIKVPVPVRESPLYEADADDGETIVTREIYKVSHHYEWLRAGPSTGKRKLSYLRRGGKVVKMGEAENGFIPVVTVEGGAEGWMRLVYLELDSQETETITPEKPGNNILQLEQSRDQLFRIYSVETDTDEQTVTAKAMHVFYDQRGNLIDAEYEPESVEVAKVVSDINSKLLYENPIAWRIQKLTGKVSGTYSYKTPVEAFLDPDEGIIKQTGALLVRDNFNAYLLPDKVRDRGVTVRRKKNLIGVTVTHDESNVITRIIPVGKNKDGDPLYLSGSKYPEKYVDSSRINDYPTIMAKRIEYDVSVGTPDDDNKDKVFKTEAEAMAELYRRAELEYSENGIDLPSYGMEVDFVLLGNTEEYANYASLQAVHLYDTVTVIDELIGLAAKLRVTGYKWNVLTKQYESVTLGELQELKQTVYSFNLPTGGVSGTKIAPNTADGSILRNYSIQYAKIAVAAINQLAADSISAITAYIQKIVSESITTDALYAALAEINKAVINSAEIKWADIENLVAEIAKISNAEIGVADIGWAQIKDLVTDTAIITEGVGGKLMISRLAVTEANMVSLTTGELVVKGENGSFYSVSVDENGNVFTTLKQIENSDVKDLSINAGEKIIEGTVTAACLNATDIFADNATIRGLMAANIDVDTLFAREAFISKLVTSNIVGDKSLTIIAGEATDAKNTAENAQMAAGTAQNAANAAQSAADKASTAAGTAQSTANSASSAASAAQNAANNAQTTANSASGAAANAQATANNAASAASAAQTSANFATPYDSEEPPATAPAVGKVWIDRGVTPAIFRRWKGGVASTDRDAGGWETVNSTEDIRGIQEQIQLQQANAQAEIDALRTAVVNDNEGVHIRKVDNDNTQLVKNELLITQKDVNMVVNGKKSSTYGDGYIRLLDMVIRAAYGGIVIEAAE